MIYEKAETAQGINRLLRSNSGIVITAPRDSGKTRELIKFAETKHPNSQFAVVCANQKIQAMIIRMHFGMVSKKGLTQAELVARRLMGEGTLRDGEVNPPLMITPSNIQNLRGRNLPIFCDEWNSFPSDVQRIIIDTGLFVAAVTS